MEIDEYILKMKEIYFTLLNFIEVSNNVEDDFQELINVYEKYNFSEKLDEILELFQIIVSIANNHQRTTGFFDKLACFIHYIITNAKVQLSNSEIFNIFEKNKKLLFYILEKKTINPDKIIEKLLYMNKKGNNDYMYFYYFYPVVKHFINDDNIKQQIEHRIERLFDEKIDKFEEKCRIGENDSYICQLIRQDSIQEFIVFVNQKNVFLDSNIQPNIYESNSFLVEKYTKLIEYAAFYGSLQIIRYLKYNNVELKPSLLLYAIHSNNSELIQFLEEDQIYPTSEIYEKCIRESIKCHHNDIAFYLKNDFSETKIKEKNPFLTFQNFYKSKHSSFYFNNESGVNNFVSSVLDYYNYAFMPDDVAEMISKPKKENIFSISEIIFSFEKITIPSSVTKIGENAFEGCLSLKQIIIPSSVTAIENNAFCQCISLTKIEIPSSVKSIGNNVFDECCKLNEITIPAALVKFIGNINKEIKVNLI